MKTEIKAELIVPNRSVEGAPLEGRFRLENMPVGNHAVAVTVNGAETATAPVSVHAAWPSLPAGLMPKLVRRAWMEIISPPRQQHDSPLRIPASADRVHYRPRQFTIGAAYLNPNARVESERMPVVQIPPQYQRLDWLTLDGGVLYSRRSDVIAVLELARDAMVGLVWYELDPPPAWLSQDGWTQGDFVLVRNWFNAQTRVCKTFWSRFPAGRVELKGPAYRADNRIMYGVLIGEIGADNQPAPTPEPPQFEGLVLKPGQLTPDNLHRSFFIEDPDGVRRGFWHPQFDAYYHTNSEHHHGSDPSLFTALDQIRWRGAGRLAALAGIGSWGPSYKWFYHHWYEGRDNYEMLRRIHLNTARYEHYVMQPQHEVSMFVAVNGELMLEHHMLARARRITDANRHLPVVIPGRPDNITAPSEDGNIRIPGTAPGEEGYSSMTFKFPVATGIRADTEISYVVQDPCLRLGGSRNAAGQYVLEEPSAERPDGNMVRQGRNAFIWWSLPGSDERVPRGFILEAKNAIGEGEFYTDVHWTKRLKPNDPGAVYQYRAPGFSILHVSPLRFHPINPFSMEYYGFAPEGRSGTDMILQGRATYVFRGLECNLENALGRNH